MADARNFRDYLEAHHEDALLGAVTLYIEEDIGRLERTTQRVEYPDEAELVDCFC